MAQSGGWRAHRGDDALWGHFQFPIGTLMMNCVGQNALVILQESVNPDSTVELSFDVGDRIGIIGNTLIYFGDKLRKKKSK